jgi:hypothetical protein
MSDSASAQCPSAKEWKLHLYLSEHGPDTTARVVLDTGDNVLEARAEAHRNPQDLAVPEIGDELAAGRALASLGERLISLAALDVGDTRHGRRRHEADA